MKTLFVTYLAAAICIAALGMAERASAQTPGRQATPPGQQPKLQDFSARLNLTQAQKDKLKAHAEAMRTKYAALRKTLKTATPAEQQAKMKQIREEQQAFLKATLTKRQLAELHRLEAEEMKKLKSGSTMKP